MIIDNDGTIYFGNLDEPDETAACEEFDPVAYRKQCEEFMERLLKHEVTIDELPPTDSTEKLGILIDVCYPSEKEQLKKMGIDLQPITMDERIMRSRKRFDV